VGLKRASLASKTMMVIWILFGIYI